MNEYVAWLLEFFDERLTDDDDEADESAGPLSLRVRQRREVRAKRLILARHQPVPLPYSDGAVCPRCAGRWPCAEVRILAGVYDNHPDWRPSP